MSRIVDTMSNYEFELPAGVIHRIQSFLTGKEAAQTTTLSKSWHRAWLTRPNLDFDESDYFSNTFDYEEQTRKKDEFFALAKKTIQRYEDSNLLVESFRLKIIQNPELANKMIVKASKLFASLVSLEIVENCSESIVIAREVFESESLLKGGKIDIGMDHSERCYNLVSLSLISVEIDSDFISNIFSSCPLIQNLSLSGLYLPINLSKMDNLKFLVLSDVELDGTLFLRDMSSNFPSLKDLNLVNLSVEECPIDGTNQRLESLSLDSVHIENHMVSRLVLSCPLIKNVSLSNFFEKQCRITYPINLPKLPNLRSLTLLDVKLESLFLDDLSSKFPALKYLTLDEVCRNDQEEEEEEIRVSSRSLERLNLTPKYSTSMFKFDVPSIKKFVIKACFIPKVSFESTSEEWESHVSVKIQDSDPRNRECESICSVNMGDCNPCSNAWFLELNGLLTALSPSNINLCISASCDTCFDYEVRDIQGLPQPRVENLTLDIQFLRYLNCYALFDGLFRNCRPQFITQYRYLKLGKLDPGRNNDDFLFKRLERGMNGEFSSPRSLMYGLHDLKEVFVQFLDVDDFVAVRPWKPLAEASEITLKPKQKIRFQLVWKQ